MLSININKHVSTGVGFSAFNTTEGVKFAMIWHIPYTIFLGSVHNMASLNKNNIPLHRFQHPIVSVSEVGLQNTETKRLDVSTIGRLTR